MQHTGISYWIVYRFENVKKQGDFSVFVCLQVGKHIVNTGFGM